MFFILTPFSWLFIVVYFSVLNAIFYITSFQLFWVFIEVLILIMMGIAFSIILNSFSDLMLYFFIQTLSSFSIMVFYCLDLSNLVGLFILMNLGVFPFMSWYLSTIYRFPNFVFFIVLTFHNIPVILMMYFFIDMNFTLFVFFLLANVLVSGIYIYNCIELRYLLLASSLSNGSWFVFVALSQDFFSFVLFFSVYSFTLLFLVSSNLSKLSSSSMTLSEQTINSLLLCNLAGLPPFPIFFVKLFIIYQLFSLFSMIYIILFVIFNCLVILSYCVSFFHLYINSFSNSSSILSF